MSDSPNSNDAPGAPDRAQRSDKRVPVQLRVRLKYKNVGAFVEKFALNVSRGGMFLASKQVKDVGTTLRFELQLADGETVVKGEGRVAWNRPPETAEKGASAGMGVKFTRLDPRSRNVLRQCLEERSRLLEAGEQLPRSPHQDDMETPEIAPLLHPTEDETVVQANAQPSPSPSPSMEDAEAAQNDEQSGQTLAPPEPSPSAELPQTAQGDPLGRLAAELGFNEARILASLERLRLLGHGVLEETTSALQATAAITPSTIEEATAALARIVGGQPVVRPPHKNGTAQADSSLHAQSTHGLPGHGEGEASLLSPPPVAFTPSSELDALPSTGMLVVGPGDATSVRFPRQADTAAPTMETPGNTQVQGFLTPLSDGRAIAPNRPHFGGSDGVATVRGGVAGDYDHHRDADPDPEDDLDDDASGYGGYDYGAESEAERNGFGFTKQEAAVFDEGLTNPITSALPSQPASSTPDDTQPNDDTAADPDSTPVTRNKTPSFFRRLLRRNGKQEG